MIAYADSETIYFARFLIASTVEISMHSSKRYITGLVPGSINVLQVLIAYSRAKPEIRFD